MSRLKLSDHRFRYITIGSLLAAAGFLAYIGPQIGQLAARKATNLASQAQIAINAGDHDRAIIDYEVASRLSPSNHQILHQLAELYIKDDRPDEAIAILKRLPVGESGLQIVTLQRQTGRLDAALKTVNDLIDDKATSALLTERFKIQLEQGRGDDAISSAEQALDYGLGNPAAQLQLGLCYAVGERNDKLATLMVSVSSPETLQALKQAQTGKIPLAYQLYAQGLLRSPKTILIKAPDLNAIDLTLLGRIELTLGRNDSSQVADAKQTLQKAIHIDPANLQAHQLLQEAYLKQGDTEEAKNEADLIGQLQSGKI